MRISGKITIDGKDSEFSIGVDGGYQQWGADRQLLGERVDLMQGMAEALMEWQEGNLCRTCQDATLNDGEGYDGECGNCADASAHDT